MTQTIGPQLACNALRIVLGDSEADIAILATLTQRELAARFRSRALEMHPDRAGALGVPVDRLERAFKQLHGAYRVLSRLVEDEQLRLRLITAARADAARDYTERVVQPAASRAAAAQRSRDASRDRRTSAGADARPDDAEQGEGRFYTGRVPETELRFAQFLYYNRVINWKTMIDAITWQYRVRPKVGEIGRAYKFLSFDSVTRVLRVSPRGELFGSTAMRLGLLDRRQLLVVLGKQHQLNYPIGRYFLENDILSRPEIDHLLVQNRRHNLKYRDE